MVEIGCCPRTVTMSSTAVAAFSLKNFNNNGIPSTSDVGVRHWGLGGAPWNGCKICIAPFAFLPLPSPPAPPLCQIAASLRKKVDDATFTLSFTDSSLKEPKLGKGVVVAVEKPLAGALAEGHEPPPPGQPDPTLCHSRPQWPSMQQAEKSFQHPMVSGSPRLHV